MLANVWNEMRAAVIIFIYRQYYMCFLVSSIMIRGLFLEKYLS